MTFYFSYVFPIITVIGLLCFFAYYFYALAPRKGTLEWIARREAAMEKRSFTFTAPLHPMTKKDALPLILLTAVYAITAFWSLGNTTAPSSMLQVQNDETVNFSTQESVNISRIEYYTGLWTGSYRLQYSEDGVNWNTIELEQKYSRLFYWLEPEMPADGMTAKYFRLSADCSEQLEMGELAFFDENGELIPMVYDSSTAALFDEQSLVPDAPSWMNSAYFDEIYHARTALEHLRGVNPYENTHPPLGKLIIAIGIQVFGMNPFGWRFMGTLFGVLMVPLLYLFLKNLFGKTVVALCGTALFTFDFMHLVQTRIATIDSYGVFFILAMFYFFYRFVALPPGTRFRKCAVPLLLSGLMFGIGCASKWIVIYGGVGLACLYVINLVFKCRSWPKTGEPAACSGRVGWVVKLLLFSVVCFVILPVIIYAASYLPIAAAKNVTGWKDFLAMVWENQVHMLTYHQGVDAAHPYSSRWYQWLLDLRPILYYMKNETELGFTTRFSSWNNPIVSWAGLISFFIVLVQTIRRRCGKGLFILIACLAQFLPWVFISRTVFAYHYFPTILFLCIIISYIFNDLIESNRKWKPAVYGLTGCTAGLYALFYPALIGLRVPVWYMRTFIKWFPSWPF